jgi:hypothetical protein
MTHADRAEGGRIRGVSSTTPAYPGYPQAAFVDPYRMLVIESSLPLDRYCVVVGE